jgi:colanic acid/amylovoran biosynthesis protein
VELEFQDFSVSASGTSLGKRAVARDIFRRNGPIKSWLREFDVVLDTGAGDSFADIYGIRRLAMMAYTQNVAFGQGIPVYLTPQTIGPFNSRTGRVIGARSLKRVSGRLSRDGVSAEFAQSFGYPVHVRSTDVVFALGMPSAAQARDVILNVSGLLWSPNPHVDYVMYRTEVTRLVLGLQDAGRTVALMAHVLENPSPDTDVHAIEELSASLPGCEVVIPTGLDDARSVLASAQVVIGSRMHACLNALSVGTPSVPWAYSRKFAPLFKAIDWPVSIDLRSAENPALTTLGMLREWPRKEQDMRIAPMLTRAENQLQEAVTFLSGQERVA